MGLRVQLVEDEPNIVVTLTYLLERAGFEVSTKTDGEAALTAALADPPAVMILDVALPVLSGLEVLRRLRADDSWQTCPGDHADRQGARTPIASPRSAVARISTSPSPFPMPN